MQVCGADVMFGKARGAEMRALMWRLIGQPCPCFQGDPCPIMPTLDAEALAQSA